MADRRRHRRVGLVRQVEIGPIAKKKKSTALVVNISRSGLEMFSDIPFQEGQDLVVRMVFMDEDGIDKGEVISAKVRWVKSLSDHYALGVEFHDLNERDHFMLLAYIRYAEGFECEALDE